MNQPQHLFPAQNQLGETPIWVPEEKALYWVDWGGGPICRLEPGSGTYTIFPVGFPVTALARRASGGWIAIAQNGLHAWHPDSGPTELIAGPPQPDNPDICYNDGAVDRQGRLLVGTVNMQDPFAPDGSLYRLDADRSLHLLDSGYATANGIGVSPDGKTVYVTDMRHGQIIALDYNTAAGTVSSRRLFARVPDEQGMPDGLIVDAEGFVWSGHWAGWKLTRYDPDGKVERQISFPVEHVISFAFAGSELDHLLVTTAWYGFDEGQRQAQPWAGDLFQILCGVKGLLEPAYAG